jgi:hypothetical protein
LSEKYTTTESSASAMPLSLMLTNILPIRVTAALSDTSTIAVRRTGAGHTVLTQLETAVWDASGM